ncbi:hypothetical protein [Streptomyces profundus]|uniref:hypothetical protein n=1 Tax=Streptomyces profundus TaxID=2867410 RepID=UPI001D167573|nr:hypothetical protein [Streptomyces sp. MA3_2.13]UED87370.1 hypothetical protein K4G22_26770 [Streptomyces sp. MA3_2.13]
MSPTTTLAMLLLALLAILPLALLTAAATAVLARWDGASWPAAALRAGRAFGAALTVLTAVATLAVTVLR